MVRTVHAHRPPSESWPIAPAKLPFPASDAASAEEWDARPARVSVAALIIERALSGDKSIQSKLCLYDEDRSTGTVCLDRH
jgi:hypothetical protein